MQFDLLKNIIDLVEDFETSNNDTFTKDLLGFKKWIVHNYKEENLELEDVINWEGKEKGRTADSVISTLLVHMSNYAKNYSKSAIIDSEFSTQEDFIYLINLRAFGKMTKMDLIKKNVHFKPGGMLIINRLMSKGWVDQEDSEDDKRSKNIFITELGVLVLDGQMDKIRQATNLVTGNLAEYEKLELIKLLNKLEDFHRNVYDMNIDSKELLFKAAVYKVK